MLRAGVGTALLLLLLALCRRARRAPPARETPRPRRDPAARDQAGGDVRRAAGSRTAAAGAAGGVGLRDARRAAAAAGAGCCPTTTRDSCSSRLAGRRRDAVPARAQPRVAVQVHEQHGDEPDVHGPQRRRARRPAAQRHPAGARRLLLLGLRLRSAAGLQHPGLHVDARPWSRRRPATRASCFSKGFALRAGYFSLPSTALDDRHLSVLSRAPTGAWRPTTSGPVSRRAIWGEGEPLAGFHYIAMLGNSLNTLDIKSANIDNRFAASATVWYDHNDFGKPWNDYEHHTSPALRVGTAFTYAHEDRLSDLAEAGPENNATFISDGQFLFATGALAPGVTISLANFYLWAIDGGIKYKGLAFNVEFYLRWLNNFTADGPLADQQHVRLGLRRLARLLRAQERRGVRPVIPDRRPVRDRRSRARSGPAGTRSTRATSGSTPRPSASRTAPTAAATTCTRWARPASWFLPSSCCASSRSRAKRESAAT